MIVVIGGQSRNVGKTKAVCDLIAATPEAAWVAVKITPHAHEPKAGPNTDTARYRAAGAAAAYLIQGAPPVKLPSGGNLVIESNSILDQLEPDIFFLIVDPEIEEWKPSALRHAPSAILVEGGLSSEHIALVRNHLRQNSEAFTTERSSD